ncbi:MAG: F0F1 ATP synthase subunit A [Actinomycetota bacterium]
MAFLATEAAESVEESPFTELVGHLSPHHYGWAPHWEIGGIDLSPTNAVVNIWLAGFLCVAIFWMAAKKRQLVPSGVQNVIEVMIDFVKVNIVYSVMNTKDGRKWFPFVGTVFFFIFFLNAVGLIPWIGFTATANIFVTATLALMVYLLAVVIGMSKNGPLKFWVKTLVPPDIPKAMLPLMVPIEVISQIARPLSLAVRLFANMLADHLMLYVFAGFIFLAAGSAVIYGILPVSLLFMIVFTAFALFVAFIQAVIFAFLTTIYINDALHPGH